MLWIRAWIRLWILIHHYLYGSGTGSWSFHHYAKISREAFISIVLWLPHDFLSLKTEVNVPSKKYWAKPRGKNIFIGILRSFENSRIRTRILKSAVRIRGSGSGSVPKCHGSTTLPNRRFDTIWRKNSFYTGSYLCPDITFEPLHTCSSLDF